MRVETTRTWLYGYEVDNLLSLLFFVSIVLYYILGLSLNIWFGCLPDPRGVLTVMKYTMS